MTPDRLIKLIEDGFLDRKLAGIYGTDATEAQRARYISLLGEFMKRYGDGRDVALFSVPGRSELSGNHTDHNHGKILAAAVSIDIIAVAAPSRGSLIRVKSKGFPEDIVDISEYTGPDSSKFGTSAALIAGIGSIMEAWIRLGRSTPRTSSSASRAASWTSWRARRAG